MRNLLITILIFSTVLQLHSQGWREINTLDSTVNGTGKIYKIGSPLIGFVFDTASSFNANSITAITEYVDYEKIRKIQFFQYPYDTASIEHFKNNREDGTFYYYHSNGGCLCHSGKYGSNSSYINDKYWNEAGNRITIDLKYDKENGVYTYKYSGKLVDSIYTIFNPKSYCNQIDDVMAYVYFTNGKIDSLSIMAFQKIEKHINYIDSTYTYYSRYGDFKVNIGGKLQSERTVKLLSFQDEILFFDVHRDLTFVNNKWNLGDDAIIKTYYKDGQTVKDEGRIKAGKEIGEWKFYDTNGVLIKVEHY